MFFLVVLIIISIYKSPHLTASLATIYVELIIELHYVAVLGHRGALVRYTPEFPSL